MSLQLLTFHYFQIGFQQDNSNNGKASAPILRWSVANNSPFPANCYRRIGDILDTWKQLIDQTQLFPFLDRRN